MPRSCPTDRLIPRVMGPSVFVASYPDQADRVYRLVMDHAALSFHFEFVQLVYGSPHRTLDPDMRLVDEEYQNLSYGHEMVEIPPPPKHIKHACWLWPRTNVPDTIFTESELATWKAFRMGKMLLGARFEDDSVGFLRWDEPDEDDSDPVGQFMGGKWAANPFKLTTTAPPKSNKRGRAADDGALTCKICVYACIDSLLVPCGHTLCESCGVKCIECPFCRKKVERMQKCFF